MPASVTPTGRTPTGRRITEFARRPHGIVAFDEILASGLAHSTITGWLRSGRLHRIHEGVYSILPPSMLTIEGRWYAAVKACGPGAVLSHGPSGQIHGIVPRRIRYALDVTVPDRCRRRVPGILIHRPRHLDPRDTTTRIGIPATTATRAIWDISSTHPHLPARRAFERAERFDLLSRPRLAELAAASPHRRGSALIRRLLAERRLPAAEVRSWLEELLWTSAPTPACRFPPSTSRCSTTRSTSSGRGSASSSRPTVATTSIRASETRTMPGHRPSTGRLPRPALLLARHGQTAGGRR